MVALAEDGVEARWLAVAAFEARFVGEASTWGQRGDFYELERPGYLELEPELQPPHADRYITLGARWARRLDAWLDLFDRQGQPGDGLRWLLEDVYGWRWGDEAPRVVDRRRREVHPHDAPVTVAYFIARLGREAKRRRELNQPHRRTNRVDHWEQLRPAPRRPGWPNSDR